MTRLAAILCLASATALAQPIGQPEGDPVPVEIALQDIVDAYSTSVTADEVLVRFTHRGNDRPETVGSSYTVRIEPDTQPGTFRRVLLELGALRVYFGEGQCIAIATSAPDRYYQVELQRDLTPLAIEELLPPIPAPQLALASGLPADRPADLTPYTPGAVFTSALATNRARPAIIVAGASSAGPLTVVADIQTARLLKFAADISGPQPASLDLTCRPVDPGEPEGWRPAIDGREQVSSLTTLLPSPPGRLATGDLAPEITLSRPEAGVWSLRESMAARPGAPLLLILWHWSRDPDAMRRSLEHAARGAAALALAAPPDAQLICAVALDLGDYRAASLAEASDLWRDTLTPLLPDRPAPALYWSSSPARSIDRFLPEAAAIAVIIAPDRRIRAVLRLDGADPAALQAQLRDALAPPPPG